MQDEEKAQQEQQQQQQPQQLSKKSSPTVGLNLGVNICDLPTLSLPMNNDSSSLSSSSSSSSSLSPHLQYSSLAAPLPVDAADPDLSPPDSGRSSMGDSLVGGLTTFFSASLSLSPSPNVWSNAEAVAADQPKSPSGRSGPSSPLNPFASAPISPFSTPNPTWSVYGSSAQPPRRITPTLGGVWNPGFLSTPHSAWGGAGGRFRGRNSSTYSGRNNIFGSVSSQMTMAPPTLEVTNADGGSPYFNQDHYGLDNNLRGLDGFLYDMIPQENDMFSGKNYYGYGYDGNDLAYSDDVNSSTLQISNFGLNGIAGLAQQDVSPMNYMHPLGPMHSMNSPSPSRLSPRSPLMNNCIGDSMERYSRKVFVGGLPPDIDEEEITASFRRFGSLVVDWPHKAESKSYFPPKGYAFLLFQEEISVQKLIESCMAEEDKLYLYVSSPTIKDKAVQIRPWKLSDADFVLDASLPLDPRKTVFVGGVPRPLKAVELASIMDRLYGGVCYAGIDIDPDLKYPKGAGRVAFSNQQSYIAAISARFVQLQHGDIDKRVEVKPYVLDDQFCDECQGNLSGGRFAPFFCANINCLQYYCESCWAVVHSQAGREFHKPLVKEGADRPRAVHFRW